MFSNYCISNKELSTIKMVELWNRLPREAVASPAVEILNLTGHGLRQPALAEPALSRGVDKMISRHPFHPELFYDSVKLR